MKNDNPIFTQKYRVYYEDTDAGGVIYHSNYLTFMERVRTEWLRHLGYSQREMAKGDMLFVVHSASIRFIAPGRLDDELIVSATVQESRRASLVFLQQVRRGGDDMLLCEAHIRIASVSSGTFKSKALPDSFVEKLLQS